MDFAKTRNRGMFNEPNGGGSGGEKAGASEADDAADPAVRNGSKEGQRWVESEERKK
jgi:hypothetical protein